MKINVLAAMPMVDSIPIVVEISIAAKVNCLPGVRLQDFALLGGSGGMPARKIFKIWVSKTAFPAF